MWLINIASVSIVLLVASNHLIGGDELNTVAGDESTTVDAFDAFQAFESAEETIDPQKEYARFKSAYDKLYHLPKHSKDIGYQQLGYNHDNHENHETHVVTTHRIATNSDDENDVMLSTTSAPIHLEPQVTAENASDAHEQHTVDHGHGKQANGPNSDFLVNRLADTIETSADNEFADESVSAEPNKLEKSVQRIVPVYFVQSDAADLAHNKENDTIDYVNDDGSEHEENSSQPITMPYAIDTTIANIPLAVSHVQTSAAPSATVPATTTTTATTMTTTSTIVLPPPPPPAIVPSHTEFV